MSTKAGFANTVKGYFVPFYEVTKQSMLYLGIFQLIMMLLVLQLYPPSKIMPTPLEVISAVGGLWNEGMGMELISSFMLNMEALLLATVISLVLSYLWVVAFFKPIILFLTKLRYWTPVGLILVFTLTTGSAYSLRMTMMVYAISVYFITGMAAVVASTKQDEINYAKTMRMNNWRTAREVIIYGKFDQAIELVRQNAAMSWMMLTMVEGLTRSEGGIGVMLLDQNKYLKLDRVFAIQFTIFFLAMGIDYLIAKAKDKVCPYAKEEERKA